MLLVDAYAARPVPTRQEFDAWVDELNRQADQEETKLEEMEASCSGN